MALLLQGGFKHFRSIGTVARLAQICDAGALVSDLRSKYFDSWSAR